MLRTFTLLCVGLCLSINVNALVIDFDPLETATGGILTTPSPYTEDGFQISGSPLTYFSQDNSRYAGSAGLLTAADSASATFMESLSAAFALVSIELSFIEPNGTSPLVTFTGNLFGGGTVMQSFTPTGFGFTQFNFNSSFTNLTSVSWLQGPSSFNGHQFDNIVVDVDVPEPGTLALLGLGLAGMGLTRRRKRA